MTDAHSTRPIVFDFNRTLFDPTTYALYGGVVSMLEELGEERDLFLYSRKSWDRTDLLRNLGIDSYFKDTVFVETKTVDNLREMLAAHAVDPAQAIIVGDMISDELCVGQELGLTTVWIAQPMTESQMLAANPTCVPDHTVRSINELRELLASL